jgi:hypothetical protein
MVRYKTIVTDYEGLQRCLDESSESGWRLFSASPDTWRKVVGSENEGDPLEAMGVPVGEQAAQYSASYYLVILYREDGHEYETSTAAAAEELELGSY